MDLNEEEWAVIDHLCTTGFHENIGYLKAYIVDDIETLYGLEDKGLIRSFANNQAFELTKKGKDMCETI